MRRIWGGDGERGLGSHDALLRDTRLSAAARGFAVHLLLLPDGAGADPWALASRPGETVASIAGYLDELEAAGYLVRTPERDRRGRAVEVVAELFTSPRAAGAGGGRVFRWPPPPVF